jgi:hypothetical protein
MSIGRQTLHTAAVITNAERVVQDLTVHWSGADRLRRTEGAARAG